jgi:hypothetical protein
MGLTVRTLASTGQPDQRASKGNDGSSDLRQVGDGGKYERRGEEAEWERWKNTNELWRWESWKGPLPAARSTATLTGESRPDQQGRRLRMTRPARQRLLRLRLTAEPSGVGASQPATDPITTIASYPKDREMNTRTDRKRHERWPGTTKNA